MLARTYNAKQMRRKMLMAHRERWIQYVCDITIKYRKEQKHPTREGSPGLYGIDRTRYHRCIFYDDGKHEWNGIDIENSV